MAARKVVAFALAASLTLGVEMTSNAAAHADPSLGLTGGRVGDYGWSVKAKRFSGTVREGVVESHRPCLVVDTIWKISPFEYHRSKSRDCAGASGLIASGPPLVASGTQPGSGGPPRMTAIGFIAAPPARHLRITFGDGSSRTIQLDALGHAAARDAGLLPFRYAGLAVRGKWCAERLVTESAAGRTLWDSGIDAYRCDRDGPPTFVEG